MKRRKSASTAKGKNTYGPKIRSGNMMYGHFPHRLFMDAGRRKSREAGN